ncbi:MAG TPA: hypothetical protein VFE62_00235 [Gemmataceae bacterium]|nr:hypothetical protein [Gemmataceae bacterium]
MEIDHEARTVAIGQVVASRRFLSLLGILERLKPRLASFVQICPNHLRRSLLVPSPRPYRFARSFRSQKGPQRFGNVTRKRLDRLFSILAVRCRHRNGGSIIFQVKTLGRQACQFRNPEPRASGGQVERKAIKSRQPAERPHTFASRFQKCSQFIGGEISSRVPDVGIRIGELREASQRIGIYPSITPEPSRQAFDRGQVMVSSRDAFSICAQIGEE